MKLSSNASETLLVPILTGLSIGFLTISNFYIGNILTSHLDIKSSIIPYLFSFFIISMLIMGCILAININGAIQKKEILFIVLLIFGFQYTGIIPGKINTSDVFFVIIIPIWLATLFTTIRYKVTWSLLNFLNLAMLACCVLSLINGRTTSMIKMLPLSKAILFSFLIIEMVRETKWIAFYLKTLVVITTISAIIGIFQEILFINSGIILAFYESSTMNLILEPTSLGTFLRVPAFTSMHLYLANYLVISLLIGFNAFLHFNTYLSRKEKVALSIALVLMGVALILTFSKTSILGLFVGIMISIFLKWPSRAIHFFMLLALLMVIAYVSGFWQAFYKDIISQMELMGDIGNRLKLMKGGIEGFLNKYPFIGAGLGQGKKYTQNAIGWPVHNAFVLAADEAGIVGLLIFCSIFLYGFYRLISTLPIIKEPKKNAILKILLAGLVALLVNIQFQPDFLSYYNWIYIGFVETTVIVFRKENLLERTS